jgi:hypothetical protein
MENSSNSNTESEKKASIQKKDRIGGEALERSKTSIDLRSAQSDLQTEAGLRKTRANRNGSRQQNSQQLLRSKSRSSWELSSDSWKEDSSNSCRESNISWRDSNSHKNSSWEGNSSGESSKSSSPEPESEFLRVFAQFKAQKTLAA